MVAVRALVEGERELRAAEVSFAAGDLEQAAVRARRAATWYLPGAPHVPAAYRRLVSVAGAAEGRGDARTALFAWHCVRSAALSSRWATVPHRQQLALANASIARLASKQPRPAGAGDASDADVEREMRRVLAQEQFPRAPWVAVMLAGFAAMILGLGHAARRGFDAQGAPRWTLMRAGAAVAAAGLAAWAAGIWFA
jgi:hypothetical protein